MVGRRATDALLGCLGVPFFDTASGSKEGGGGQDTGTWITTGWPEQLGQRQVGHGPWTTAYVLRRASEGLLIRECVCVPFGGPLKKTKRHVASGIQIGSQYGGSGLS
jgi:hypothetical protein